MANIYGGNIPLRVDLTAAAQAITTLSGGRKHVACVVLGSGFSKWAQGLPDAMELPIDQLPNWPTPTVQGHSGKVFSVVIQGKPALILAGRVHSYEYLDGGLDKITFPVCASIAHGCRTVFLTNAAGSVNLSYKPGDLVLLSDHINRSGLSVFSGPDHDGVRQQPVFPYFADQSDVYSAVLRGRIKETVSARLGIELPEGVYAWMRGRTYETPAEIRELCQAGVDQVGMSTVPEAQTAYAMGALVAGMSLITNYGAGIIAGSVLDHDEVTTAAKAAMTSFTRMMDVILPILVSPEGLTT